MTLAILTDDYKAATMEARLLFPKIFDVTPDELLRRLDVVQKRAKKRTLEPEDIREFLNDLTAFVKICLQHELPLQALYGRLDGGAVSNSYGNAAQSTQLDVNGTTIVLQRHYARSVAHGDDGRWSIGLRLNDTTHKDKVRALGWTGAGGYWRPKS